MISSFLHSLEDFNTRNDKKLAFLSVSGRLRFHSKIRTQRKRTTTTKTATTTELKQREGVSSCYLTLSFYFTELKATDMN